MRFFNLVFFFTISVLAQTRPLEVKIDSISSVDLNPKKRQYTINYHIENITNQPVSFFLTPYTLIANAASSMTLFTIYKIYINGELTPLDGPFYERVGTFWDSLETIEDKNSKEFSELVAKIRASLATKKAAILDHYKKTGGKSVDENWILKNQNLLESIIVLNPKETKSFVIKTNWDRERYIKNDDLEYYLEEKDHYAFELILDLKKTSFKEQLSTDEFLKISTNPNFIEGLFTSNKIDINFK